MQCLQVGSGGAFFFYLASLLRGIQLSLDLLQGDVLLFGRRQGEVPFGIRGGGTQDDLKRLAGSPLVELLDLDVWTGGTK